VGRRGAAARRDAVVAGRRPRARRARGDVRRRVRAGAARWSIDLPPADAAVDATGDPTVWERLPHLVRAGGARCSSSAACAPGTRVSFDAERLHYAEISVVGSFHSAPEDAREAIALLASGRVDPAPLIAGRGGLSELPGFLAAQARGEGVRYAVAADA
jgi:L-iditol 2-dehydrogenase